MPDLDEVQLAKLARELVMNIRNYAKVFEDYGITEEDYQLIEKNEFYRKVREQFAVEWNSALSTEERIRLVNLAYFEQLSPVLTRRAMQPDTNLGASTDVGKLLMKAAGIGEVKNEKSVAERFVITINLGADVEHYDKSIEINPNDEPPKEISDGKAESSTTKSASVQLVRSAGEGGGT
jgi:hypothetical protein